eukprot:CAMPEP_0198541628 /NCGR_PEP_ID=MMETSP1462-20131121/54490_1 /TAXON_ID=1333877 /ORGANISM="Brandtodinium nutriculum, Strain RCC3387" /LENGTH=58 /DNA_ID=CAMNT_0044271805 /DNA_START=60 /DNA_END=233 /DNA_ORIENTATION=+
MARLSIIFATLGVAASLHQLPRFAPLEMDELSLSVNVTEPNSSDFGEPNVSNASAPAN